jgi:8-oxo-dGTP pyrophosphatase MutT (NUDIX family)
MLPELRVELTRSPEAATARRAVLEETGRRLKAMATELTWLGLG